MNMIKKIFNLMIIDHKVKSNSCYKNLIIEEENVYRLDDINEKEGNKEEFNICLIKLSKSILSFLSVLIKVIFLIQFYNAKLTNAFKIAFIPFFIIDIIISSYYSYVTLSNSSFLKNWKTEIMLTKYFFNLIFICYIKIVIFLKYDNHYNEFGKKLFIGLFHLILEYVFLVNVSSYLLSFITILTFLIFLIIYPFTICIYSFHIVDISNNNRTNFNFISMVEFNSNKTETTNFIRMSNNTKFETHYINTFKLTTEFSKKFTISFEELERLSKFSTILKYTKMNIYGNSNFKFKNTIYEIDYSSKEIRFFNNEEVFRDSAYYNLIILSNNNTSMIESYYLYKNYGRYLFTDYENQIVNPNIEFVFDFMKKSSKKTFIVKENITAYIFPEYIFYFLMLGFHFISYYYFESNFIRFKYKKINEILLRYFEYFLNSSAFYFVSFKDKKVFLFNEFFNSYINEHFKNEETEYLENLDTLNINEEDMKLADVNKKTNEFFKTLIFMNNLNEKASIKRTNITKKSFKSPRSPRKKRGTSVDRMLSKSFFSKALKEEEKISLLDLLNEQFDIEKSSEIQINMSNINSYLGVFYSLDKSKNNFFKVYLRRFKIDELEVITDVIIQNVTDIKLAELSSLENKLKQKLFCKLAHEFKTPMIVIKSLLQDLKNLHKERKQYEKEVEGILNFTLNPNNYNANSSRYANVHHNNIDNYDAGHENHNVVTTNTALSVCESNNVSQENYDYTIADEIKQNLISIKKAKKKNTKKNVLIYNHINSISDYVSFLINDVIYYTQNEKMKLEISKFNLNDVVVYCKSIAESLIDVMPGNKKMIKVTSKINSYFKNNILISSDKNRLIQVILNLISNSVKFTKSGKIEINLLLIDKYSKLPIDTTNSCIRNNKIYRLNKNNSRDKRVYFTENIENKISDNNVSDLKTPKRTNNKKIFSPFINNNDSFTSPNKYSFNESCEIKIESEKVPEQKNENNNIINLIQMNINENNENKEENNESQSNFIQTNQNLLNESIKKRSILKNNTTNALAKIEFSPSINKVTSKYKTSSVQKILRIKKNSKHIDQQNLCLVIQIKDTGIGIKKSDLKKLQLKPDEINNISINIEKGYNEIGTGLGINICKDILSKLQLEFEIKSKYTKGSEFNILFNNFVFESNENNVSKGASSFDSSASNNSENNNNNVNPIVNDITLGENKNIINLQNMTNENYDGNEIKNESSSFSCNESKKMNENDLSMSLNTNKNLEKLKDGKSKDFGSRNSFNNTHIPRINISSIISKNQNNNDILLEFEHNNLDIINQKENLIKNEEEIDNHINTKQELDPVDVNEEVEEVMNNQNLNESTMTRKLSLPDEKQSFINYVKSKNEEHENYINESIINVPAIENKLKSDSLIHITLNENDKINFSFDSNVSEYNDIKLKARNITDELFLKKSESFKTNSLSKDQFTPNRKRTEEINKSKSKSKKINYKESSFKKFRKYSNYTYLENNNDNKYLNSAVNSNIKNPLYIESSIIPENENKPFKQVIMTVDDTEQIRKSVKNLVVKNPTLNDKYEVIESVDGIETLYYVMKDQILGNNIFMIITDENMEYMMGSKSVEIIRELENLKKTKQIYIASLTAFCDDDTKEHILSKGANIVVSKPLSNSTLKMLIDNANLFYDEINKG